MSKYVTRPKYHVGDKVWIPLPARPVCGIVKEDRGNLGVGGRRLYHVDVSDDPYTTQRFLMGEDEMQPYDAKDVDKLSTEEMIDYLIHAGLISIFQRNSSNRVWLRRDSAGNVTYTYIEEYGETGGQPAPSRAVIGQKIFEPAEDKVRQFVQSFGLSEEQAQFVIEKVGKKS